MTIYDAIPLICMGAGVLFTLCVFVLLYKEKVYIDRATTEPTEFELPLIGKIKTHTPILGLLVFAMLLVLIPLLTRTPPDRKAELNGNFTYPASLKVYAVVGYKEFLPGGNGKWQLTPSLEPDAFDILYIDGECNSLIFIEQVSPKKYSGNKVIYPAANGMYQTHRPCKPKLESSVAERNPTLLPASVTSQYK